MLNNRIVYHRLKMRHHNQHQASTITFVNPTQNRHFILRTNTHSVKMKTTSYNSINKMWARSMCVGKRLKVYSVSAVYTDTMHSTTAATAAIRDKLTIYKHVSVCVCVYTTVAQRRSTSTQKHRTNTQYIQQTNGPNKQTSTTDQLEFGTGVRKKTRLPKCAWDIVACIGWCSVVVVLFGVVAFLDGLSFKKLNDNTHKIFTCLFEDSCVKLD